MAATTPWPRAPHGRWPPPAGRRRSTGSRCAGRSTPTRAPSPVSCSRPSAGACAPALTRDRAAERLLAAAEQALAPRGAPRPALRGRRAARAGGHRRPRPGRARPRRARRRRLRAPGRSRPSACAWGSSPTSAACRTASPPACARGSPRPSSSTPRWRSTCCARSPRGPCAGGAEPFVWSDPRPLFRSGERAALAARPRPLARPRPGPAAARLARPGGAAGARRARSPRGAGSRAPDRLVARRRALGRSGRRPPQAASRETSTGGLEESSAGDVLARVAARGEGAAVELLFARARERGGDAARLERLELLAGVLDPERASALAAELWLAVRGRRRARGGPAAPRRARRRCRGVGGEVGGPARQALLASAGELARDARENPPWAMAFERAIGLLRGARAPQGLRVRLEKELLLGLERELGESGHPLTLRLRSGDWPPRPGLEALPLEALEVRLGP